MEGSLQLAPLERRCAIANAMAQVLSEGGYVDDYDLLEGQKELVFEFLFENEDLVLKERLCRVRRAGHLLARMNRWSC